MEDKLTINPENYKDAILADEEVSLQFSIFSKKLESNLIKILRRYLEKYDMLYLQEILRTILKELINNAVKANLKRLYFQMKELDINDQAQYRTGMDSFKEEVYTSKDNERNYFDELIKSPQMVKVVFKSPEGKIMIQVLNNAPILDAELKKVESRIKKAFKYNELSEAFDDVLDDSEGAGLGLIMGLMLFKHAGFPPEFLKITRVKNLTAAVISIPSAIKSTAQVKLTNEILKEIERIPPFPQVVTEIKALCANPDSTIREIAEQIKKDPGITTDMLRQANSAYYMTANKVSTIEEAVKIIGLKGVETLVLASNVKKIMASRYKRFETIWDTSYKSAFYAQNLAGRLGKPKISDVVYLAALLADIGRIIFISLNPEKADRLKEIAGIKGLDESHILEEINLGISHSTLGTLILKKWDFDPALTTTIEYHHRPYMASAQYRDMVYIVYLADILIEIESGHADYDFIDENVLEYFSIGDTADIQGHHTALVDQFEAQKASTK